MKFYLSSFKIGNQATKLQKMAPINKRLAYIPNALDFITDETQKIKSEQEDITELEALGFNVEVFDLKKYFDKKEQLKDDILSYGNIWVRGGNVFVLRQAMKIGGFDKILLEFWQNNESILYGGYSSGVCVLAPSLKGLELVDDINQKPYLQQTEVIFNGLGILDYAVAPHYKSEGHPETQDIDKVVDYYIKNKILFKTLTDGEVIIIE